MNNIIFRGVRLWLWFCCALMVAFAGTNSVAATGWNNAALMATGRDLHTATLLPSGKVLVAGGAFNGSALASAELYDPATNTWSAAGSMTTTRMQHTATLLANGKVLAAGGTGGGIDVRGSAEIYDPVTNTWSAAGSLNTGRLAHTASLLSNGKIVVVAGRAGNIFFNSVELYDPSTNAWSVTGVLATAREGHTAIILLNGKVLAAGGTDGVAALASAELYDPAMGSWSPAASLTTARTMHTSTLLTSGKVLVAGGALANNPLASVELYDPATNTWSAAGNLNSARALQTATVLPNGKVLAAGGLVSFAVDNPLLSTNVYDAASNTWSLAGNLTVARNASTATLLADGSVLVVGGRTHSNASLASVERYDQTQDSWSAAADLSQSRSGHTATLLPNGKVLATGGNTSNQSALPELYDTAGNTWSTGPNTVRVASHTATLLSDGKVLLAGGAGYAVLAGSAGVICYDPATNIFSLKANLTVGRSSHTATLLANGKVLAVGGNANTFNAFSIKNVESYNPATNAWAPVSSLTTGRSFHTATLLNNGKLLVAGGIGNGNTLSSAELYDPTSNTWNASGNLGIARYSHTAITLANGKVLVVGGTSGNNNYLSSVELYDPATNTWSAAASLNAARGGHAAALLRNGKVLVTGGYNGTTLASAELYDVSTNTWITGASLATARSGHTATLLLNGKVLIAGGMVGNGSAELYDPGLAFDPSRQPALSTISSALTPHQAVSLTGIGFRAKGEGSSGNGQNSATNFPLVKVERVDNGLTRWLTPDPTIPFTDTTFTSTASALAGFQPGQAYVTVFVNGIPSASQMILITGPIAPSAPAIGTAAPGDGRINVAFTAPASDGGSAVIDYTATCGTQTATATSSPIVVAGVAAGVALTCTVQARNIVGLGAASAASNSVTPFALPPVTIAISSSVNPVIVGNNVTFTASVIGAAPSGSVNFRADSLTISGCGAVPLAAGSAQCVTTFATTGTKVITAEYSGDINNAAGTGTMNGGQVVMPISAPGAPTLNSITPGPGNATVNFSPPANNGGSPITSYTANCGASGQLTRTAHGSGTPITVGGLTTGVAYLCFVTATNGGGLTGSTSGFLPVTATKANINISPVLLLLLD